MASVCPRLLATFTNGIVCEYVPGEVLTKALVNHLDVGIRVAAAMAKLHANTASFPIAETESVLWHRLYSRGEYKAQAIKSQPKIISFFQGEKKILFLMQRRRCTRRPGQWSNFDSDAMSISFA